VLSPIEERIVLRVADGGAVDAIAAEVGVAARTVEWHLARARRKLEQAATLHDRVRTRPETRRDDDPSKAMAPEPDGGPDRGAVTSSGR
jgi:hypothetical protein